MEKILKTRACLRREEIQGYFDNTLSEEQRFNVENHLLDCPLCEAAVEGLAATNPKKAAEHLEQIKAAIPNISANADSASRPAGEAVVKKLKSGRRNWLAAAAAIGLLLLASLLYLQSGQKSDIDIFASSYEIYESPFAGTRASNDASSFLDNGLSAYQAGDFANALPLFESAIEQQEDQYIAHFHAGLCALQLNQLPKAQDFLLQTRINAPALYGPASWYLALSHLKANETELCMEVLQQIKSNNQEYYPKAQGLLSQLQGAKE